MDLLEMAALAPYLHNETARSALPNAPVLPDGVARFARVRGVVARVLHRVADALAPEPAAARPTLAAAHK
jgi:hypothetical protein